MALLVAWSCASQSMAVRVNHIYHYGRYESEESCHKALCRIDAGRNRRAPVVSRFWHPYATSHKRYYVNLGGSIGLGCRYG
jgi:hypothetical protein